MTTAIATKTTTKPAPTAHEKNLAAIKKLADKFDADSVYSYSGRGMMGRRCPAFNVSRYEYDAAFKDAKKLGNNTAALTPSYDTMGRDDMVIYFPTMDWTEGGAS